MLATTTISIRTDENIKKQAQELYASLGLDLSGAINAFLHASIKARGIPFAVVEEQPDEEYRALILKTVNERLKSMDDPDTKWITQEEMEKNT